MKLRLILLTLIVCFPITLFAAPPTGVSVTGKITDAEGNGIPYATVALLIKDKRVAACIACNDKGVFELMEVEPDAYSLQVSCLGYQHGSFEVEVGRDNANIGTFALRTGVIALDAVTLVTKRALVKTEVDRITYDVASDPDAATSNLMQILDKVPFVSIDANNKINVFGGTTGFTILLNGRKSLYLSENNQYMAEVLAALKVKEIELITSPSGKYMGNMAVINIVTAAAEQPNTIALNAGAYAATEGSGEVGIGLTSKIERFIFNLSYNCGYSDLYGSEMTSRTTDYGSEEYRYSESRMRNDPDPSYSHRGSLSGSYDITANDLITLSFNMNVADNTASIVSSSRYYDVSDMLTRETGQTDLNSISRDDYTASLNYQRTSTVKPGRMLTATYSFDSKNSDNAYDRHYTLDAEYEMEPHKTQNRLANMENTIGADFYNPINADQNYYVTVKYVDRLYGSESWRYNAGGGSGALEQGLDYRQRIGSVRGNYSLRGKRTMFTGELTYEYTDDRADFTATGTSFDKKDHDVFARLRFTYRPGKNNTIIMSADNYSYRPDITFRNPYEDRSVAGKITKGNPDLENVKQYAAMIIYRHMLGDKLSMSAMSVLRYSGNAVTPISYIDNDGVLVSTFDNISKERMLYLSSGVDYDPTKNLQISLHGRMGWNDFEYGGEKNSYWEPWLVCTINWQTWKGGRWYFQMRYQTDHVSKHSDIQAQKQHCVLQTDIQLRQNVTKDLSVSLSVFNPWKKYYIVDREYGSSEFFSTQRTKTTGRVFSFGVSYKFGRFSEQVKTSRRTIRNTDRTAPE